MRLVNGQELRVSCGFSRNFVSFITCRGIFRLLKCTSVKLVLGFVAAKQVMATDSSVPGCVLWVSYRWETGDDLRLKECIHVVGEHGRSN